MNNQPLLGKNKHCLIEGTCGAYRFRLGLSLGPELTRGPVIRFTADAIVALEGADAISSTYTLSNWEVGLISGALYAFRTLQIVRQRLIVNEFSGHLRSSDSTMLANIAAEAVAKLADRDLPGLELEAWNVKFQVTERPPSTSSKRSQDDHVALSPVEGVPLQPPSSAASA